jgi:hypothetical protein
MRINRKDSNEDLAEHANIFFNGERQKYCFEANVDGGEHRKRGTGYVIRAVLDENSEPIPTILSDNHPKIMPEPFDYDGIMCEKVFGKVTISV